MKHLFLAIALLGCGPAERASLVDADPDPIADTIVPDEDSPQDSSGEGPRDAEDPGEEDEPECVVYYEDTDGDGYGGQSEACLTEPTEGYVENSDDCCDDLVSVNPAQEAYFGEPYTCPEESFDYNCDGVAERIWDNDDHSSRRCENPSCHGTGWYPEYPSCGDTGVSFGTCYLDGRFCRADLEWSGQMRCR